ncbi:MAG: hypothetical protein PHE83_09375 [Opitutaceae bacterium]|nr:hypothetical protein [Opitutaceae bacterium]
MPDEKPETVTAAAITPTDMPAPTVPAPSAVPVDCDVPMPPVDPLPAPASGEVDRHGKPFDPARHVHTLHPKTGAWMPRRKPRAAAASAGTGAAGSPSSPPPAASFIPPEEPPAAPPADTPPPEPAVDHSSDAAEVVCRSAQFALGIVFDAPEACTPAVTEHKHMVEATAAYIRAKGWQAAAGVGLVLMFAAWLLKVFQHPKPMAKIRGWFQDAKVNHARDVTPEGERPGGTSSVPAGGAVIDIPANIPPLAKT